MREGGGWRNEVRPDLRPESRIRLALPGEGARPSILARQNSLARGIYDRLASDDRSSAAQIPSEVEWWLEALASECRCSARDLVF